MINNDKNLWFYSFSRKEALKILLEESFPYEIDYLLGDIEEESQIQEEYVL